MRRGIIALFVTIATLLSHSSYAQQQKYQGPKDFVEATGLFMFDVNEIFAKCKITDQEVKNKIAKAVGEYTEVYNNVYFEHNNDVMALRELQTLMMDTENQENQAMVKERMSQMRSVSSIMRNKMVEEHKKLLKKMETILKDKQYKKWRSYYMRTCMDKSFRFEMPRDKDKKKK